MNPAPRTVWLAPDPPQPLPGVVHTLGARAARRLGVPQVRLSALARETLEGAGVGFATHAQAHRLLTAAVAGEERGLRPASLARAWAPAVRELHRAGADLALLARGEGRAARLARVTLGYRAALGEQGLTDPAWALRDAAPHVLSRVLSLTGYAALAPDELCFLDAAAAPGSVVHLPWEEHPLFAESEAAAAWLAERGWAVVRSGGDARPFAQAFLGRGENGGRLHVHGLPYQELRGVLGQVKGLLRSGVPAGDIALVVSDTAAWEHGALAMAAEYGVPLWVNSLPMLGDTSVGQWLERLLQTVTSDLGFEPTARLLAHPLDRGLEPGVWAEVRRERPQGEAWRRWAGDLGWPGEDTRSGWVRRLRQAMRARGVHARSDHADHAAVHALEAELGALAGPPEAALGRAAFADELRDLMSLVPVGGGGGRGGVELLTPSALIGARVPHVFVLGANDGALPSRIADDPALDLFERRALQGVVPLSTAERQARVAAVTFWAALRAADSLCWSRSDQGATAASPYLLRAAPRPEPPPLLACSPEEARRAFLRHGPADPVLALARTRYATERRRQGDPGFDEFDGHGLPPVPAPNGYSVSELAVLGACGFRWWLQRGLGLQGEEEPAEAATLGSLRHLALHLALQRALEDPDPRQTMADHLPGALERAERELDFAGPVGWPHRRDELLARLEAAVRSPRFWQGEFRPHGSELRFAGEWQGLAVRGTVDRADRTGGAALLTDYKAGSAHGKAQDREGRLRVDVQLAVYRAAAHPVLFPDHRFGGARYLSLKDGRVTPFVGQPAEEAALAGRLRAMLGGGDFAPYPDREMKACRFCSFHAVCRHSERLQRKAAPWEAACD